MNMKAYIAKDSVEPIQCVRMEWKDFSDSLCYPHTEQKCLSLRVSAGCCVSPLICKMQMVPGHSDLIFVGSDEGCKNNLDSIKC